MSEGSWVGFVSVCIMGEKYNKSDESRNLSSDRVELTLYSIRWDCSGGGILDTKYKHSNSPVTWYQECEYFPRSVILYKSCLR